MALALVALTPEGVSVRSGPPCPAVGVEVESPVGVVCEAVVASAESAHAFGVAVASVCPGVDVVGVGPGGGSAAAGKDTAAVSQVDGSDLMAVGEALGASGCEWYGVEGGDDGPHHGVAQKDAGIGEQLSGGVVHAVGFGGVDDDGCFDSRRTRGADVDGERAAAELDEGLGEQLRSCGDRGTGQCVLASVCGEELVGDLIESGLGEVSAVAGELA